MLRVLSDSSFVEIEIIRKLSKFASAKSVGNNAKKKPFETQVNIEFIKMMHPWI